MNYECRKRFFMLESTAFGSATSEILNPHNQFQNLKTMKLPGCMASLYPDTKHICKTLSNALLIRYPQKHFFMLWLWFRICPLKIHDTICFWTFFLISPPPTGKLTTMKLQLSLFSCLTFVGVLLKPLFKSTRSERKIVVVTFGKACW